MIEPARREAAPATGRLAGIRDVQARVLTLAALTGIATGAALHAAGEAGRGRRGLGVHRRGHDGAADLVGRPLVVARRPGRRSHRPDRDDRRPGDRGVPRGCRDRPDAVGRKRARGGGVTSRSARAHGPAHPDPAYRPSPHGRYVGGGRGRAGRRRRSRARARGRAGPGGRDRRRRGGDPRRVHDDRRVAAGRLSPRRDDPQRHEQRRRSLRAAGQPPGGRERLRRPGACGSGRAVTTRPLHSARGPLRRALPPAHARRRRRGLAAQRRPGPRGRRPRRRDSVPTDPRRAHSPHVRPLASGPVGGDRQGRSGHRGAWRGAHGPARQDRHIDAGDAVGGAGRCAGRTDAGRAAAPRRIGGPALRPCARRGTRPRGRAPRPTPGASP